MRTATEREPDRPSASAPSPAAGRSRPARRAPFEHLADIAWHRAGRRGFVPGHECEYYLESELDRLRRSDATRDS